MEEKGKCMYIVVVSSRNQHGLVNFVEWSDPIIGRASSLDGEISRTIALTFIFAIQFGCNEIIIPFANYVWIYLSLLPSLKVAVSQILALSCLIL